MIRIRSGYSFRQAAGMLEDVMARVKACELPFAPLTDRASTFGWVRWNKLCEKNNIKPLFGIELAVTTNEGLEDKKAPIDYWTFIAIDDIKHINNLLKIATTQFYYEPKLTYEQACKAPGVIRISGNSTKFEELTTNELFVALSPSSPKGFIREALARGYSLVAASDNKFASPEDEEFYEVLCGRNASTQTYDQFIQNDGEWITSVRRLVPDSVIDEAYRNLLAIGNACNAKLKKARLLTPEKRTTLEEMCRENAPKLGVDLNDPEYAARLQREIKLIYEKEFENYFYIIADVMKFARKIMICGPARGSSCGSLVCYLLEITTIDPLKYGLLFERFIDITRNDLPDIDIDFSDQKREMVFDYMKEKYGADHIARLGTVALFRPRSAIEEVGTALQIPRYLCDRVVDSLIVRSGGDSRALQTLEDTFKTTLAGRELLEKHPEILIAGRMEGHPRHYSQHAAGIVVTETPVADYVGVDSRTGATHCDKKDAEDLNLLKIDALGLTQLSVFEDALELAGKDIHFLEKVPLDDPLAFSVLMNGHFSGIFQFNGQALQSICKQITVNSLNDIVSITALARPGPMAGGGTNEWIKRKIGRSPVTYPHPIFEPYIKETLGIITYQEQVMRIGREVGDLSWEDVSTLRKAMSKSLGKEFFDQYGNRWKAGAIKKGIPQEVLDKVWDELCAYGAMGFNKSHAVAYGIVSYWCCYLKAHFPLEFAAATLTHVPQPEKQIMVLREMAEEGIDFVPVDPETSTDKWTIGWKDGRRVLVGPLQNVKGMGPKTVKAVLSARSRTNEPFPKKAAKLLKNPATHLNSLWPIRDAIRRIMPDPAARGIFTPPTPVMDLQCNGEEWSALVLAVVTKIAPRDENEEINIARRGGKRVTEFTTSLNMHIADDTDRIFAKIDRFKFETIGREIVERGRPGKAIYAFKGRVPTGFRMLRVEQIRFIGFLDDEVKEEIEQEKEEETEDA